MTLAHYPGKTDGETIRSFHGDGPERVKFEKVLGENCGPGNPAGANQHMPEERGNHDNVMDSSQAAEKGNTLGYAIRRLSRERPDLPARVEGPPT